MTVKIEWFFISLNEMIKETLRRNQQLQSEAKDAEIAFLRSQIKPHFLYNALNSIAALCTDEPRKTDKLTLYLSQVLRSGFDFKQLETFTSIENKLELIKPYLHIEKSWFGRHGVLANFRGGTVKIAIFKKRRG